MRTWDLFADLVSDGFDLVEIRREYLSAFSSRFRYLSARDILGISDDDDQIVSHLAAKEVDFDCARIRALAETVREASPFGALVASRLGQDGINARQAERARSRQRARSTLRRRRLRSRNTPIQGTDHLAETATIDR